MANTPKTPMTRAEYDAQILQNSRKALVQSYRVLRETDALLTIRDLRPATTGSDPRPRRDGE
ncbi:hypothetical protein FHR70_004633 [Microvirga lupini]|uniref:Uncharacterized protein n=1 Tax=Microvirga lupini TaxID=420324 RepID=A0A7W4YYE3_9HYPH|nr:hypothetical protein [Microvirga lupini]